MNFNQIGESPKTFDLIEEKSYERMFVKDGEEIPCAVCKTPTGWCNISFSAPICSHECTDEIWKSYFSTIRSQIDSIKAGEQSLEEAAKRMEEEVLLHQMVKEGREDVN